MDRGGAWQTTVHGVTKSRTRLSYYHTHFPCCKMDRTRVPCSDDHCGGCVRFWPWEVVQECHDLWSSLSCHPGSRLTQKPCRWCGELHGVSVKSQSSVLAAFPLCSLGLFLSLSQSKLWSNAGCPPESSSEIGQSDWCDRRSLGTLKFGPCWHFWYFLRLSLSPVCSVTPPCMEGSARPWPLGSSRASGSRRAPLSRLPAARSALLPQSRTLREMLAEGDNLISLKINYFKWFQLNSSVVSFSIN